MWCHDDCVVNGVILASNGICEDGGPNSVQQLYGMPLACDLGRDCTDCGDRYIAPNETGRVTSHSPLRCRFSALPPAPPTPPPPPRQPAGLYEVAFRVELTISVIGTCTDIGAMAAQFKSKFSEVAGGISVDIVDVEICGTTYRRLAARLGRLLSAPSESEVDVTMAATFADESAANQAVSSLIAALGTSRASLQAAFGDSLGLTVTSAPKISITVIYTPRSNIPPPAPPPAAPMEIFIIIGAVAGMILIGAAVFFFWRQRARVKALKVVMPWPGEGGALLPGWVEVMDPRSGQPYYANASAGETTWERPVSPGGVTLEHSIALPPGWFEVTDPSSGRSYYANTVTGETTWARPLGTAQAWS